MNINAAFSSYLKVADLDGKRVMVTIDRVEIEAIGKGSDQEQKPILYFAGHEKGLVLNKTNAATIQEILGTPETEAWSGQKIVLLPAKTDFGGKRVDCIRIMAPPKPVPTAPVSRPSVTITEPLGDMTPITDSDVPFGWLAVLPLIGSFIA